MNGPEEQGATLHTQLQAQLQKEVYLMRELLANMHQEEISLMLHDQGSVHQLLQQRASLLDTLSSLRVRKRDLLGQLEHVCTPLEISSLSDQIATLSEKVHRQTTTNQRLTSHPERYHHLGIAMRPKKKVTVATLQIKQ